MLTHTIQVNRDLDGRYLVVVDGVVHRATFNEQEANDLYNVLIPQSMSPARRDRMLDRAIGRSH